MKRIHVSVVAERCPDGKMEIFQFDPHTGRTAKTGWKVVPAEAPEAMRKVAEACRRNGLIVKVKAV